MYKASTSVYHLSNALERSCIPECFLVRKKDGASCKNPGISRVTLQKSNLLGPHSLGLKEPTIWRRVAEHESTCRGPSISGCSPWSPFPMGLSTQLGISFLFFLFPLFSSFQFSFSATYRGAQELFLALPSGIIVGGNWGPVIWGAGDQPKVSI